KGAAFDFKCNDVSAVRGRLGVNGKAVGNRGVGRNHRMSGADSTASRFNGDHAVGFDHFLYRAVPEELHAVFAAGLRHPGKVFEWMEGRLPGITQYMTVFAPV